MFLGVISDLLPVKLRNLFRPTVSDVMIFRLVCRGAAAGGGKMVVKNVILVHIKQTTVYNFASDKCRSYNNAFFQS